MKINEIVREMSPPRYTASQAAVLVGRSKETIKRWHKTGVYVASDVQRFGQTDVPLYTSVDIHEMKRLARQGRVHITSVN